MEFLLITIALALPYILVFLILNFVFANHTNLRLLKYTIVTNLLLSFIILELTHTHTTLAEEVIWWQLNWETIFTWPMILLLGGVYG